VLIIALDIDGVVANFTEKVVEIYNQRHLPPIRFEDFKSFSFEECFSPPVVERIVQIFNEPGFFASLQPLPRAIEIVDLLSKDHHVEICTAPPHNVNPLAISEKISWALQHWPHLGRQVTVTTNKYLVKSDILIDDSISNITKWCMHHPQGHGFLVSQPWNADILVLPDNATRGHLVDVPDFIKHRSRNR